jgi:hypothetical protein
MAAMSRLRARNRTLVGAAPGGASLITRPTSDDPPQQTLVGTRIRHIGAAGQDRDGSAPHRECAAVRRGVNAVGGPAHHSDPGVSQPGGEIARRVIAVRRGRPRPHDGHRPSSVDRLLVSAAKPEPVGKPTAAMQIAHVGEVVEPGGPQVVAGAHELQADSARCREHRISGAVRVAIGPSR